MGPTGAPFTEEAVTRGVNYLIGQASAAGLGVALVDLDNDGDPDLVTTGRTDGRVGIFENTGGGFFADRSVNSGIPPLMIASAVIAADYDADGDLDLFFTQTSLPNVLMRNEGGFKFVDVSAAAGVDDDGAGKGPAWGDYDNDGWIDLYVTNRTMTFGTLNRDILYHNNGDGTFTDVSAANGLGQTDSSGHQAIFLDYDRDGDCDLYLSNDGMGLGCAPGGGWRNEFHENIGGAYINVTEQSGAGLCMNSMGVAVGDLDGNGYPDLYSTNTPEGNVLLLNNGDKTFTDATALAGVGMFGVGWGANFFDYNNDGIEDLYVCNMIGPNSLYVGQLVWPMLDQGAALGLGDTGKSFCSAVGDIDNDGDLDIVMTNQETFEQTNVRIYINHEGETRNWIKLRAVGNNGNTFAVGAMTDVRVGAKHYYREVYAGTSWKSQDDMTLHVGLGDAAAVDEITTIWPGGETRTIAGFPTSETWSLVPDNRLGDVDGDGAINLSDFVLFASAHLAPFVPGSEFMDFDGDADVDNDDYAVFLARFTGHLTDCDNDGLLDMDEILADPSLDANHDGSLDSCDTAPPTSADLNGDGVVNGADLATLLTQWGMGGAADLDRSGVVDGADLALLLTNWG